MMYIRNVIISAGPNFLITNYEVKKYRVVQTSKLQVHVGNFRTCEQCQMSLRTITKLFKITRRKEQQCISFTLPFIYIDFTILK